MSGNNVDKLVLMAVDTGVFREREIEVLKEVLEEHYKDPGTRYSLIVEKGGKDSVTGYVVFGRTPLTEFSWDIYWLVVDKKFQGRGLGKKLLKSCETFILKEQKRAVLRAETSSREEYFRANRLYMSMDFGETGRISDFYAKDDDLVIYSKGIERTRRRKRTGESSED